eukprot:3729390-Rhodomonas_salina.1
MRSGLLGDIPRLCSCSNICLSIRRSRTPGRITRRTIHIVANNATDAMPAVARHLPTAPAMPPRTVE